MNSNGCTRQSAGIVCRYLRRSGSSFVVTVFCGVNAFYERKQNYDIKTCFI